MTRTDRRLAALRGRWPWTLCSLCGAAVAAQLAPALARALEDRRELVPEAGLVELWRPLSGHAVHGSALHLALNLLVLAPLLLWRERKLGSSRTLLEVLFLAAAVALGVRLIEAHWTSYRGFSGVVYGLLVLWLCDRAFAIGFVRPRFLPSAALAALVLKTLAECVAGGWVLGRGDFSAALGVTYLPGSHLAGIAGAAILYGFDRLARHGARSARADAAGSGASMSAPMTAAPAAPASRTCPTFASVMPPRA
jgi:membrane associated rhomboid family serine protease